MAEDIGDWKAFVMAGTRTGKLATTRADGRPHVVPVWFVVDADDVVFTAGEDSVKGRAIARDPRVCMCVDDETPPFAFAMLEGVASISRDVDELRRFATAIGGRYMGADRAAEFGTRNAVAEELLVRFTPAKVVARKHIAG